jgi:predicted nucleic acid-binding protein
VIRVVVDTNILVSFAIRPNENFEQMFDFLARQGITLISDDTVSSLFFWGFYGKIGKELWCNPDHNETRLDILPAFSTIPLPSLRFTGKPAR